MDLECKEKILMNYVLPQNFESCVLGSRKRKQTELKI